MVKMISNQSIIILLALGVFSIINTEMGVVGIIPLISQHFRVDITQAAWVVSVFALVIAVSAPILPLLCSSINRKTAMIITLGVFTVCNMIAAWTEHFSVFILMRIIPAFLHPIYVSMAFSIAANSVAPADAPKAVAGVFVGVSAGMVLGVPITAFIAHHASLATAMLFFAFISALVLLATCFMFPSMPVKIRLTYGSQIQVLKQPAVWYAMLAIICMNGAFFGFFSYIADFLAVVTHISSDTIAIILLIYGGSNIIGNILAGKLLATSPKKTLFLLPILSCFIYILLYILGKWLITVFAIIAILGILAGIAANNMQYMLTRDAEKAPDFANGLFLSCANLGTTFGTVICGIFLTLYGTPTIIIGTVLLLIISMIFVVLRLKTV